ncbi:hypothetical protein B0H19DRAFT_1212822 [Mycena capillaripes]|nr:hypothetical protein B0H19DRAFT_1212822 [Mycena capillaripes]
MTSNAKRLEELQLIQFTLLPAEVLSFLDDEGPVWSQLLHDYTEGESNNVSRPSAPPHIQVKPQSSKIWFEVQFPTLDNSLPSVSVKGENATRSEQERWQSIIQEKMDEIATSDFPRPPAADNAAPGQRFHALFTSHHLISPKKRRSLQQWSASLSVAGFAKVGYPGVIYAQGEQGRVEEFVANVRAMQWLALRLRFLEPLPVGAGAGGEGEARGWTEFEKVGEAVEAMRQLGLENWIVEMGVGSRNS